MQSFFVDFAVEISGGPVSSRQSAQTEKMGPSQKDKVPKQRKCHCEPNVTKLAPSEKVKIGTRTAHSATEQRLCAVFLKKGMTRKRIEKSAKKSYSKRINYATL